MLSVYTRISDDPIIFFVSIGFAAVISVTAGVLLFFNGKKKNLFTGFEAFLSSLTCFFALVVFITFGPVFIDRSISYHLAFYASEQKRIYIDDIREEFSSEIFEKRIHDAIETGFLKDNGDGSFSPSPKAEFMTMTLLPLGKLTGSLGTYENMKEKMKDHE
ncbi:MAG: hypothetical protein ACI4LX_11640 [Treponema sp.]